MNFLSIKMRILIRVINLNNQDIPATIRIVWKDPSMTHTNNSFNKFLTNPIPNKSRKSINLGFGKIKIINIFNLTA